MSAKLLMFPAHIALGGVARQFAHHRPAPELHEHFFQKSLETVIERSSEAMFASAAAREPSKDREGYLSRALDAAKAALFAAISANGCKTEDRAIYDALLAQQTAKG